MKPVKKYNSVSVKQKVHVFQGQEYVATNANSAEKIRSDIIFVYNFTILKNYPETMHYEIVKKEENFIEFVLGRLGIKMHMPNGGKK